MDPMVTDDAMAPAPFGEAEPEPELLSYDDTVPYEEQIQPESESTSLANRIGRGKIYLLEDAAPTAGLKRKVQDGVEDEVAMMEEDSADQDPYIRSNALFFTGQPIAHLPTTRIFAYATQFEAHPLGLEWVSDTSCVLVFSSKAEARKGFLALQKYEGEEPSIDDDCVSAKPIPVTLWPAEERISRSLGLAPAAEEKLREREKRNEGLSAPLRMRWARIDDVKKKGARHDSEFYKKHGNMAGKELVNGRDMPSVQQGNDRKRRREDVEEDEAAVRARLDDELDAFLAEDSDGEGGSKDASNGRSLADRFSTEIEEEDETSLPPSPPSKMRSDYIGEDGRSAIRKRDGRRQNGGGRQARQSRGSDRADGRWMRNGERGMKLSDRIGTVRDDSSHGSGPERKRRRAEGNGENRERRQAGSRRGGDGENRRSGGPSARTAAPRPKKTQQELDDELDAFLAQG